MSVTTMKRKFMDFARDESGMGTVEVVLIMVVLVGLVVIFKGQVKGIVEKVFGTITKRQDTIIAD
ncbi:MAG: Flp1 family type IVb pilin [Firmicutes bacterium]|nr:Flp1 family type IVb pilin [Bacillota bacterium]